jgi:hypothetical protein
MKSFLSFSLDYNGECEDVETYEVDGQDLTDDVYIEDVDVFVTKLSELDEFSVSEHRTEVQVWWLEDGTMDIHYRYFNEPDDDKFDDHKLTKLTPIEFVMSED